MAFSTEENMPCFPVASPHFIPRRSLSEYRTNLVKYFSLLIVQPEAKYYDYLYSGVAFSLGMLSPSDIFLKASAVAYVLQVMYSNGIDSAICPIGPRPPTIDYMNENRLALWTWPTILCGVQTHIETSF